MLHAPAVPLDGGGPVPDDALEAVRAVLRDGMSGPASGNDVLSAISAAFGAQDALLVSLAHDEIVDSVSPTVDLRRIAAFARQSGEPSPWLSGASASGRLHAGQVVLGADVCPPEILRRSVWFDAIHAPMRLGDFMAGFVSAAPTPGDPSRDALLAVVLSRPLEARRFGEGDRSRLVTLLPDVERAAQAVFALRRASRRVALLEEALQYAPVPMLVIDDSQKVLFASDRDVVSGSGVMSIVDERLVPTEAGQKTLRAAIRQACAERGPIDAVFTRDGRSLLLVRVLKMAAHEEQGARDRFLLVLVDPEVSVADESLIARSLGLTPAQARVAHAIANNMSVAEVAMAHEVSEATVRSQLRAIFARLGLRRQSELVRLITQLVRDPLQR